MTQLSQNRLSSHPAHVDPVRKSRTNRNTSRLVRAAVALTLLASPVLIPGATSAQQPAVAPAPTTRPSAIAPEYAGRRVNEVRIIGANRPLESVSEIAKQVRTREGQPFDPETAAEDYKRVAGSRKFSNVRALVEPTTNGVIVIFEVTQQNQIREIGYRGNISIDTLTLQNVVDLRAGEGIDSFRIGQAREAIGRVYQNKNYPYTHVEVDEEELNRTGVLTFNVIEGPRVRIRKIRVLGNNAYSNSRIKDQVKSRSYFPFFVSGRFDAEQLEQDVANIREFYENNGFFDVRVGRKVVVGEDQREVMIDFVIEEGPRYVVEAVRFRGNNNLDDATLRSALNLVPGEFYNNEVVRRDLREIVRAYSPLGYVYVAGDPNPDPDYLRIAEQRVFKQEPGKVEIVYVIEEGKPFRLGRVLVKGNARTQDKVIERELRVEPGQLYNSGALQDAASRIRATNLFANVTITPIKIDPEDNSDVRDLLVEVNEQQTAKFIVGAGVTSNSGLLGQISYEQRNFDIGNWPANAGELFSSRAFTGAGQTFRVSLEPGTELTRARVDFIEPYLFDQPYSFGASGYLSQRLRRDWAESRVGGRFFLGHRFNDTWSARVSLRAEDVEIGSIDDEELRAREVLELEGHTTIESLGLDVTRSTIDNPILPSRGTTTTFGIEHFGALFSDYEFDKLNLGFNWYGTVYEDLLDRRTILSFRADAGYITGDAPFFERYYGGGIGSVRGFRFRGISPRSGVDEDPVGGDFSLTGSLELNFPIAGEVLRGVVFADGGTVQEEFEIGTFRSAVGFGFRLTLPFFGQLPLALDFGFPLTKDDEDDTRIFSFSLGQNP